MLGGEKLELADFLVEEVWREVAVDVRGEPRVPRHAGARAASALPGSSSSLAGSALLSASKSPNTSDSGTTAGIS